MLKQPDFAALRNSVLKLLPEIAANHHKFIEYGETAFPHRFGSVLRIKNIATPGGVQLCIKNMHLGMEGSGDYLGALSSDNTELFDRVVGRFLEHVAHFHRPSKLRMAEALAQRMNKSYDDNSKYDVYVLDSLNLPDTSLAGVLRKRKEEKANA